MFVSEKVEIKKLWDIHVMEYYSAEKKWVMGKCNEMGETHNNYVE